MIQKRSIYNIPVMVGLALVLVSCQADRITRSNIRHAQKLFGMQFSAQQIRTMQDYLERNREGYGAMREKPPGPEIVPAIRFDPIPAGFEIPTGPSTVNFDLERAVTVPDNPEALAFYSVADLSILLRERRVTSEQLTRMYLDRIKRYDSLLEAVITITEERAMEMARKADMEIASGQYKGPLHGIPYGVKDLLAVEGYKTTWGAMPYRDQEIAATATVVERLDAEGAVLIAKLTSGALARGDVWFGGKTKNPWDLEQGASGSSAGSGAAVASGLVAFAIGTETLGSITSPSTRCGVTGLRPTYGRVSRSGVMSLAWSMDKVGPMCRTAEDCAIVFSSIHGKDPGDPMTVQMPFSFDSGRDVQNLRIGYFKSSLEEDTTSSGDNAWKIVEMVRGMGFIIAEPSLPESLPRSAYDIILRAESGAFFDELLQNGGDRELVQQHGGSRANSLRQSRFIPAVEYLQANRHRSVLISDMHRLMQDYDVIITPTFGGAQLMITNLTGHPVISVPSGFDEDGHPTSVSLLGNLYDEESILKFAAMIQERIDAHKQVPEGFGVVTLGLDEY